jgi:hypothetical protein
MGVVWVNRRPQAWQKFVPSGLRLPQPEQINAESTGFRLPAGAPQRWQKDAPSLMTPPH